MQCVQLLFRIPPLTLPNFYCATHPTPPYQTKRQTHVKHRAAAQGCSTSPEAKVPLSSLTHPFSPLLPPPLPLPRVQADQERKIAAEARKERRQTGEIETLRGRLRELEANQKEKEEEMKGLRRSLRQKELSLLTGSPAGASSAGGTLHGL